MGENRCAGATGPVVVDERLIDRDTLRHEENSAGFDGGGVEAEKLLGTKLGRFLQEILLHQFGMLLYGLCDR